MPVKSEIMLSAQIDNGSPWGDTIFPLGLLEDDSFLDMRFLDYAINDETNNSFINENIDFSDLISSTPASPKNQIRYHDCMWSGTCVDESHPSKRKGMFQRIQPSTSSATTSSQQNQTDTSATASGTTQRATVECVNSRFTAAKAIMTPTLMKSITPVTNSQSVVLSRVNTNTALMRVNTQKDVKISIEKQDFDIISSASLRPDTPHSLGDEVSDFKNNIDLTPCPSGNRMKFSDQNSHKMINMLREHLEDINENSPFVMNMFKNNKASASDLNDLLNDITFLSDYEDNGDESSGIDMDEDMTDESSCNKTSYNKKLQQATTSTTRTPSQFEFISDHSYTRKGSKEDFSSLGVETPSDSGEFQFFLITYTKYIYSEINHFRHYDSDSDIIAQA